MDVTLRIILHPIRDGITAERNATAYDKRKRGSASRCVPLSRHTWNNMTLPQVNIWPRSLSAYLTVHLRFGIYRRIICVHRAHTGFKTYSACSIHEYFCERTHAREHAHPFNLQFFFAPLRSSPIKPSSDFPL